MIFKNIDDMLKKYPQFSFAFAIVFFAELFAVTHQLRDLRLFSKPLITISLMLFLFFTIKRKSKVATRIQFGLFFSLLGDVFLMFNNLKVDGFIFGLASFFIAHLLYISAFYLDVTKKITIERRFPLPIFFVFGFFCLFFYAFLFPYLKNGLALPVLAYCMVITLMAITAALRFGKTNYNSFLWVFVGAVLFIISDSILAYNRFVYPFDIANLLVMASYMLAQYLIVMGIIERKFVKKV
jgi:uncharacterized membrane protein YhhN